MVNFVAQTLSIVNWANEYISIVFISPSLVYPLGKVIKVSGVLLDHNQTT